MMAQQSTSPSQLQPGEQERRERLWRVLQILIAEADAANAANAPVATDSDISGKSELPEQEQ